MDVKIFQSQNLGFIVAELDDSVVGEDTFFVINPRIVQMYVIPAAQNGGESQLSLQLMPVVYREVLSGALYKTELQKCQYTDVTDQFAEDIIDMYIRTEGRVKDEAPEGDELDQIDLFEGE